MIKLITPPGMLVTVALLAIYCAYASWTAFIEQSWIHVVVALVSLAACVGAALLKSWCRYPVYALTVGFVVAWCYSVYAGIRVGFFGFFFLHQRPQRNHWLPDWHSHSCRWSAAMSYYATFVQLLLKTRTTDRPETMAADTLTRILVVPNQ